VFDPHGASAARGIARVKALGDHALQAEPGNIRDECLGVTFIARGAHLEAMQRDGLGVEGGPAPFHLEQVQATGDPTGDRAG